MPAREKWFWGVVVVVLVVLAITAPLKSGAQLWMWIVLASIFFSRKYKTKIIFLSVISIFVLLVLYGVVLKVNEENQQDFTYWTSADTKFLENYDVSRDFWVSDIDYYRTKMNKATTPQTYNQWKWKLDVHIRAFNDFEAKKKRLEAKKIKMASSSR